MAAVRLTCSSNATNVVDLPAGGAGHQHQAAAVLREVEEIVGQGEIAQARHVGADRTQRDRGAAVATEEVHAPTPTVPARAQVEREVGAAAAVELGAVGLVEQRREVLEQLGLVDHQRLGSTR
ncbi:MAG: hypothetical protein U0168_16990 [Nannocystaceae bacterium]